MWRAYARREDLFGISLQSQHLVATTGADTLAVSPHEENEILCASFISIRSLLILSQTRSPYASPPRTDPPAPPQTPGRQQQ